MDKRKLKKVIKKLVEEAVTKQNARIFDEVFSVFEKEYKKGSISILSEFPEESKELQKAVVNLVRAMDSAAISEAKNEN